MNGAPLPERNGYPVRVIVPGLFGEKNVKWVTRITLIDYDHKGFYEQQGWGPNFAMPISSRFDVPRSEQNVEIVAGHPFAIKGVAFAGNKGVGGVEISTDDAHMAARRNYLSRHAAHMGALALHVDARNIW
jgi:DMSO/TMAO reductase YedYZ molybdopterin-dependent catalytic subunit